MNFRIIRWENYLLPDFCAEKIYLLLLWYKLETKIKEILKYNMQCLCYDRIQQMGM